MKQNIESTISLLMSGGVPNVSVKSVVIEDHLDGREADLVASLDFGPRLAVVSDADTFEALGRRVEKNLASKFKVQRVTLARHPHPDEETLEKLIGAIDSGTDAIIAVGSGTINDLCKMAAHRLKLPQAVFGTAPSMNGYTSVNAAITVGGLKKSLHAVAPSGVFLDLGVLAAAPKRLIRSGLGDSLCRPTAQADWLLAHLLLDQPYQELPFELLVADEKALFAQARALISGDLGAMRHLARTLVLSGFGMTICGGSYPASQGEHLISHYVDMMGSKDIPETFHGEQIGVTTLKMAELQEKILRLEKAPTLKPSVVDREQVLSHFGAKLGEACWKEFEAKRLDKTKADALNERLEKNWHTMRARIESVTISAETLKAVLVAVGGPVNAKDLGWPEPLLEQAFQRAREIRNRYTFLDFAADLSNTRWS